MKTTLLCGVVLALAGSPAQELAESKYYPMKIGSTWEYAVGGKTVTVTVAKHEKVGDVMCAVLETTLDGREVGTEHVAAKDDGIYRHTYNGQAIDPPVRFLKLPPKKDETWEVEYRLGELKLKGTFKSGEEDVEVPAGKYKTVTSSCDDLESQGQTLGFTFYFAEGVGIVKQVVKIGDKEVVLELSKFQAGK